MRGWFAHPWLLAALASLPVLGVLTLAAARRRRRALLVLGASAAEFLPGRWARRLRGVCLALGLCLVGLGAAGPQWGRDWTQSAAPGRDLVVVLDRSRSMLAETPSRLARAREALLALADELARRGGHRVALVTFAGRPKLACPLTHDYDHFREVVAAIDPDTPDPDLAPPPGQTSGTRIGLALVEAVRALDGSVAGDVLLLSDGDDPGRDGEWRAGAAVAHTAGAAVLAVGLGDPDTASPVPAAAPEDDRRPLELDGRAVMTRLEEGPLREIAAQTGGTYEPARTRTPPLGPLYAAWVAARPVRDDSADALPVARQRPAWFLAPALALLALATALGDRRRKPLSARREERGWGEGGRSDPPPRLLTPNPSPPYSGERGAEGSRERGGLLAVTILAVLLAGAAPAPDELIRAAYAAFERGDLAAAADLYERAELRTTEPGRVAFDLAAVKYRLAQQADDARLFAEAERLFACCVGVGDPRRPEALLGIGNCRLGRGGADALKAALAAYAECERDPATPAAVAADARHNAQRARLLLAQLPPAGRPSAPPPGDEGPSRSPDEPRHTAATPSDPTDPAPGPRKAVGDPAPANKDGQRPRVTDEAAPGKGHLPPIPDRDDLPPLAAPDAAAHLERAVERLRTERQRALRARIAKPPAAGVRDW